MFDDTGFQAEIVIHLQQLRFIDGGYIYKQREDIRIFTDLAKTIGSGDVDALFAITQFRFHCPLAIFRRLYTTQQEAIAVHTNNTVWLGIARNRRFTVISKSLVSYGPLNAPNIIHNARNTRLIRCAKIDINACLINIAIVPGEINIANGKIMAAFS